MSADRPGASSRSTRLVLAIGFALLLLGLLTVAVVTELRSDDGTRPEPALTATPMPSATEPDAGTAGRSGASSAATARPSTSAGAAVARSGA